MRATKPKDTLRLLLDGRKVRKQGLSVDYVQPIIRVSPAPGDNHISVHKADYFLITIRDQQGMIIAQRRSPNVTRHPLSPTGLRVIEISGGTPLTPDQYAHLAQDNTQ